MVWGGEFGVREEGSAGGRDHHPRCFTVWLAAAA